MAKKKAAKKAKAKSRKAPAKASKASSKKKTTKRASAETSSSQDIIQLILADHKPLKRLIEKMKSEDIGHKERHKAFMQFAPLLLAHAKPEEQVLYVRMKEDKDMRMMGFEGDVEHSLADQMIEEAKRADDEDLFCAKVKVLAELVEHHIEEEEEELLPEFKKNSETEERRMMGAEYTLKKDEIEAEGSDDAPPESDIIDVEEPEEETEQPRISFKKAN